MVEKERREILGDLTIFFIRFKSKVSQEVTAQDLNPRTSLRDLPCSDINAVYAVVVDCSVLEAGLALVSEPGFSPHRKTSTEILKPGPRGVNVL